MLPTSDVVLDSLGPLQAGAAPRSLSRLRHECARPDCPFRGKPWSRWLNRSCSVEFAGQTYCCASCAEPAFECELEASLKSARDVDLKPHRIPLGLLLISRGLITHGKLQEALDIQQRRPGRKLGELLCEMGILRQDSLLSVLSAQWGCPVFPLNSNRDYRDCVGLLPFALLQARTILPVHHSPASGILHLAFSQRIDHTVLYAIEGMLGYRVVPCIAAEQDVAAALHYLRSTTPLQETVFDSVRQPQEMARMAADYARTLQVTRVRATLAAEYFWFRFENSRGIHDLLFQSQVSSHLSEPWLR